MKFSRKARHEVLILLLIISSVALVYQLLFGSAGYMAFALLYPTLLGTLSAWLGFVLFRRGDLI